MLYHTLFVTHALLWPLPASKVIPLPNELSISLVLSMGPPAHVLGKLIFMLGKKKTMVNGRPAVKLNCTIVHIRHLLPELYLDMNT